MEDRKEIDLLDILIILAKRKWFIFWVTFVVSIGAVIYSLVTPEYWTSKTVIKPYSSNSQKSSVLPGLLGGFAADILNGDSNEGMDLLTIIGSRTFSEKAIRKFNLIEVFKIEHSDSLKAMDSAVEILHNRMLSTSINEENGTISVLITTKDKHLSRQIANFYISELDRYNQYTRKSKARLQREFVESRVDEITNTVESLSYQLKEFQEKNGVLQLDEQASITLRTHSDLISQKIRNDFEIEMRKAYDNETSKNISFKEIVNELIEEELLSMYEKNDEYSKSVLIPLKKIPSLLNDFSKIQMNLSINKSILEYLYPQLEAARISEIEDTPTIELIDKPNLPGIRTKPKRAMICTAMLLVGLFLSISLVLINHFVSELHKEKISILIKTIVK